MTTEFQTFGEHLRYLREQSSLTLKEVANNIHVDTSLLAKIERSERQPTSSFIKNVASFFSIDESSLRREYLSEQIAYKVIDEDGDLGILKAAESKVEYLKKLKNE
jgi:transcriptional regulator with XRE-family HTH domain